MPLQTFSDRHPDLISHLLQVRRSGRTAHAYLFSGDHLESLEGLVGAWLQACLCEAPTPAGDGCGGCRVCRQLRERAYPYCQEIRPRSKSRQVTIEAIRDLERFLNLKSAGKTKVGLIVEADCMNEPAQNAFLKTLEEPASDTLLVLATTTPARLLPTIRSRCQSVAVRENRVRYDFPGWESVVGALAGARRNRGATAGATAAGRLLAVLEGLEAQAGDLAREQFAKRQAQLGEHAEASLVKRIEEERLALERSLYLGMRSQCLSVIQAWFSQQFLRAMQVPKALVPHPEFLGHVAAPPPPEAEAREDLDMAEELLRRLQFNVEEKLAICDFCQQLCRLVKRRPISAANA